MPTEEEILLVEEFGTIFAQYGSSRSAGRILGWLMITEEPQSLDDIAKGLKVSKATVSNNTRLLEQMGLLRKIGIHGDRKDYYHVADGVWTSTLAAGLQKLTAMQRLAQTGLKLNAGPKSQTRFAEMNDTIQFLTDGYLKLLAEYQNHRKDKNPY